jgi:hypothetical protein
LEIGDKVLKFLRAHDPSVQYKIVATTKESFAWHVRYEVATAKGPVNHGVFVSLDGRYLASEVERVAIRLDKATEARRIARCLREKQVKVFVDPAQSSSQQQLEALGAVADAVVINCGGAFKDNCKKLGVESFPTTKWPGGGEIGVHRLPWFGVELGCL